MHRSQFLFATALCSVVAGCAVHTTDPNPGSGASREGASNAKQRRIAGRANSRLRVQRDETGRIPQDAMMRAKKQMIALRTEGTAGGLDSSQWSAIGPGNIGGRIRAIAFHPTTHTTIWIGSVSGGIWKTTNGGTTWAPVNDLMTNLTITSILVDPSNANTLYASTGEDYHGNERLRGAGIFKSTNGGTTWARLTSTATADFYWVNRLDISPNGATLLAATSVGMFRSTNGGTSWALVHPAAKSDNVKCNDVKFHPTNSSVAVAHYRNYDFTNTTWFSTVVYTTNGGASWTEATGIRSLDQARIELAWHAGYTGAGNGCVYAQKDVGGTTIYRSINGGQSFTQVSTNTGVLGGQGFYDNTIWVDPTPADSNTANDRVIVGGIDLYRSTNGGSTFGVISDWQDNTSAHADHHAIVPHPGYNGGTNKVVYFGNDGGIYRTDNVHTVSATLGWVKLNNGLQITQFYGGSMHAPSGTYYGGTQDNGTLSTDFTKGINGWTEPFGGDGGFSASDQTNGSYHYGEYTNAQVHRSSDGAVSAESICGQYWNGTQFAWKAAPYLIPDARNEDALFIAPFVLDPNNPNRLLVGGVSLWRSNDCRTANTNTTGPSWASIRAAHPTAMISAIAVKLGNSDEVWVGYDNGDLYMTSNGTAASPTWTKKDGATIPNRYITRITLDRVKNRVFVTLGGYETDNLWESTNNGTTWAAKTGLPAVPLRDVAIHGFRKNWLYVASEVGLLVSENNGTTWTSTATPSTVTIDELFWTSDGYLMLVTHGRGFFEQTPYRTASTVRTGPSCGPTAAKPLLTADPPTLGRTMTVTVSNAPTNSTGLVFVGAKAPVAVPFLGCLIQILPATITPFASIAVGATGTGTLNVPIPNDPAFANFDVMMQVVDGKGGFHLSNGLLLMAGY